MVPIIIRYKYRGDTTIFFSSNLVTAPVRFLKDTLQSFRLPNLEYGGHVFGFTFTRRFQHTTWVGKQNPCMPKFESIRYHRNTPGNSHSACFKAEFRDGGIELCPNPQQPSPPNLFNI